MPNQAANNNLNYLIYPTFTNVNRLFVLSFENEEDRTSFSKYYVPKVEIKDFNVLIDGKPFSEIPVKSKEEAYEGIIEMSKNNDYTTNLLDYEYLSKHYRLIEIEIFRLLEMPLINWKIHLELNWNNHCVMYGADAYAGCDNANNGETIFKITSTKLHVPIVTLSAKDNVNLTKQLNEGFKRSVY